jgi:hypothetical protein
MWEPQPLATLRASTACTGKTFPVTRCCTQNLELIIHENPRSFHIVFTKSHHWIPFGASWILSTFTHRVSKTNVNIILHSIFIITKSFYIVAYLRHARTVTSKHAPALMIKYRKRCFLRAEPSRAEPTRAEPSRAEPSRDETWWVAHLSQEVSEVWVCDNSCVEIRCQETDSEDTWE